jgi:hypothetical protein
MKKPLENITIGGVKYDVFDAIPSEENKLIYYKGGELTPEYLMYTDGLVVDKDEDFELCKQGADVSMSTVSTKWNVYGSDTYSQYWGYCDSIPNNPEDKTKNVILRNGSTQTVPIYTCNGKPQDYIFNTNNTTYLTGFYSDKKYSEYDSITSAGIVNSLKNTTATDYMAIVPAIHYDSSDTTSGYGFCGISLSVNNTSNTNSEGREIVGAENHTVSIIVWKQNIKQNINSYSSNTNIQLLSNIEGQRISKYDSTISNGTNTSTYSSSILTRVKRKDNLITMWVSNPYRSDDDDSKHTVNNDNVIIVDLLNYILSYTYKKDDGTYEKVVKNFKADGNANYIKSNNEVVEYDANNLTTIRNIFDKLRDESYRGYEVLSNPGSIFRNLTTDELILNMSPDENFNTTWEYYQDSGWTNSTQKLGTPTQLFTGSKLSFNRLTNKLFYSDGTDVTHIANIGDKTVQKLPSVNVDTDLTTIITLSNLKSLRDGGLLIPGMKYRITDYVTTVNPSLTDVQSAGHVFDIIVEADDESTLNENVRFIQHSGDTYFSGSTLESWEGKYCIDNDTTRFDWADDTPTGKGVIYWLKDEYNNECSYDFKNIQFKRIAITDVQATGITSDMLSELQTTFVYERNGGICYGQVDHYGSYVPSNVSNINTKINYTFTDSNVSWYYTFTWVDNSGDVKDASVVGQQLSNDEGQYSGVFNNQIQPVSECIFYPDNPDKFRITLNNIVFISSYSYEDGFFFGCYGNKFSVNCYNNTFGNYCNCNTFGSECYNNTFGYLCIYNTFENRCYSNTLGNYCRNNTLGNDCRNNTLGKYCDYNTFGNDCYSNTFGNGCGRNTFGKWCYGNTFEDYCYNNTFGNYCYNNILGNNYEGNTFGNNCYRNTFGNDYMYGCRFGDNVQYCKIGDYVTTGSNQMLMNIIVLNGTKGNYNNILNLDMVEKIEDGLSYQESSFTYNVSKSTADMIPSVTCGYVWNSEHTQVIYQVKNNFETI